MMRTVLLAMVVVLAGMQGRAQQGATDKPDEVDVTVLPKKGMKFDPKAIYHEDQAVLQGIFGTGGGDEVNDLELLPSKEIIAVGRVGAPGGIPAGIPRGALAGAPGTGNGFVALFDPAFRTLEKLIFLPADVTEPKAVRVGADGAIYICGAGSDAGHCFVIKADAGLRTMLWRVNPPGGGGGSMVVMPDNSVVVHLGGPFIGHIRADGAGIVDWGAQHYFRIDRANAAIFQKYWIGLGYQGKGFGDNGFLNGGISGLGLTPDGNLVIMACNAIRDPGGSPDFDPMLVKFNTAGEVLWVKNLVDGIPSEPDQKNPRLYVDPYTGDLILTLNQHGSFGPGHDLNLSPGCYLTANNWFTGDCFLGWIGRVDSVTGVVKAATLYFPDLRKAPVAGKKFANSLFPEDVRTDADGHIYVVGATAYKLATTPEAFQPEPLGGNGFLTVFDAKLSNIIYASFITAQGVSLRTKHLVIGSLGPVVASVVGPSDSAGGPPPAFVTANTEKTNFLKPQSTGGVETMLSLFPSQNWFADSD